MVYALFDPALWLLAEEGGRVVGAALCRIRGAVGESTNSVCCDPRAAAAWAATCWNRRQRQSDGRRPAVRAGRDGSVLEGRPHLDPCA